MTGPGAGRTHDVTDHEVVIGRGDDADVKLADAQVSRRHAAVRPRGDGRYELVDLDSANGTYLNGKRIDSPAVLTGTQQIQVGGTVFSSIADSGGAATMAGTNRATYVPTTRASTSNSAVIRLIDRQQRSVRRALALGGTAALVAVAIGALLLTGVIGGEGENDPAKVVKKVAPSTVLIEVIRDGERAGTGSGWVVDGNQGLVVTNAHVLNDGTVYRVIAGGTGQQAEVVGMAPCEDLAVLRVATAKGKPALQIEPQSSLTQGQTVVAVGYPESASADAHLTSTTGSISVVRLRYTEPALDVPQYPNVLQTDVPINPGSSGGPLVTLDGRLAGVNSAGRTSSGGRAIQGQGFAIGSDRVADIVGVLRSGRSLGWTGMTFDYPSAQQLEQEKLPPGLLVTRVVPGSPAEEAGLGSSPALVTAINGTRVDNTLASYCAAVEGIRSGQTATLTVVRGDKPKRTKLRVPFA